MLSVLCIRQTELPTRHRRRHSRSSAIHKRGSCRGSMAEAKPCLARRQSSAGNYCENRLIRLTGRCSSTRWRATIALSHSPSSCCCCCCCCCSCHRQSFSGWKMDEWRGTCEAGRFCPESLEMLSLSKRWKARSNIDGPLYSPLYVLFFNTTGRTCAYFRFIMSPILCAWIKRWTNEKHRKVYSLPRYK